MKPARRLPPALLAALALVAAACGSSSRQGDVTPPPGKVPPILSPPGTPVGEPAATTIGPAGGVLVVGDGALEIDVPAGAVASPTRFTAQPITNLAVGGVGRAFRLSPEGALGAPVRLVFRGPATYQPGTDLEALGVAYQDSAGFWRHLDRVERDRANNTLAVTVTHFSDWGVVWQAGVPGLYGAFHLSQTVGVPFTATGGATFFYQGSDTSRTVYVMTGTVTLDSPTLPYQGLVCTPPSPGATMDPTVAEVRASPLQFRWAVNAQWPLACVDAAQQPSAQLATTVFDTLGINLVGCPRALGTGPIVTQDHLAGTYAIDCGAEGTVAASWDFVACIPGVQCTSPTAACNAAAITCDTGQPVCADTGALLPAGTGCGADQVCSPAGECVACVQDADCTPAGACSQSRIDCSSGAPVCTATTTPVAAGTSCGTDQVCDGAGACVSCAEGALCTPPGACVESLVGCATGAPVCSPTATPVAAGTICGTDQVCDGVGTCVSCVAGQDCTPPGACVEHQTSCSTGTQTCEATATPVAAGTTCGADQVCDGAGLCVGCVAGQDCTPAGACFQSVTSCASGAQTCVGTSTPVAAGTTCGADQVCDGAGLCVSCASGQDCTPADACVRYLTSCATGASVCLPTTTPIAAGTTCGANQVCNGEGACVACEADVVCTPEGACFQYLTSCQTGASSCDVTSTPLPAGSACGPGMVCDGAGACNACAAGLDCTPPTACVQFQTSCSTGAQTCDPTSTPLAAGTPCGTYQVCDGVGGCACDQGASCPTPDGQCFVYRVECGSGTPQCQATAELLPDQTSCGPLPTQVCLGGVCQP